MESNCIRIRISESKPELLQLISKCKSQVVLKRLLCLYVYVNGESTTFRGLAKKVGASRDSVSKWFKLYKTQGIAPLLVVPETGPKVGSSLRISESTISEIMASLQDPEKGFNSFLEIKQVVDEKEGKAVAYSTVHRYFKNGQKAKLKRLRPSNIKKEKRLEEIVKKKAG